MGFLPILCLNIAMGIFFIHSQIETLRQQMHDQARTSSQQLSLLASKLIRSDQMELLTYNAKLAIETPGLRSVRILDANYKELVQVGPRSTAQQRPNSPTLTVSPEQDSKLLSLQQAILSDDNQTAEPTTLGWVAISFSTHAFEVERYKTLLVATIAFTLALLLSVGLASYINYRLRTEFRHLRKVIKRLSFGEKNLHAELSGYDELNDIAEAINQLTNAHEQELIQLQQDVEEANTDLRDTLETVEIQNIELDLARREALNASKTKSEFLANTSHELRTPLNGILGFSNILLKSNLTAQQLESVNIIKNSSNNLLSIINDILDFSKLESGKLTFDKTPFALRETLEETIAILAPEAHQKDLELLLFIDENTPEYLLSDPLRLKQVFTNLLNNAIKFTPSGNIQIKVVCNDIAGGKTDLSIQFCDTGIGLSGDQQKQIFKDFIQADTSTTRQYGGTGLGLVIARRIIENMGGEIGVSSQVGEGSVFWVNLKLPIINNAAPARNFNELAGKTVAYFDPNPLHAKSLAQMLKRWEITCIHCEDFKELVSNPDFVLICSDNENFPSTSLPVDIPVIYVVSYNFKINSDDTRCYISKPISQLTLFDALAKGKPETQPRPPVQFPHINVLAVDDTASNLQLLRSFLADLHINVHTAKNGIEAVNQCKKFVYDLILMDLQMPLLDGVGASTQIKREGFNRQTPIVALSAYTAPSNPQELRDAGIADYMSKPISEDRLISTIQKYCSNPAAQTTSTEIGSRPVDVSECLARTKNDTELAKSMLTMLFETLASDKIAIATAYKEQNLETLEEHIHSLKGACSYTGTPHLKQILVSVEDQLAIEKNLPDGFLFESLLEAMENLLEWRESHDIDIVFSR